jgi:pimeloyl-ACP methyl ester carboxylesterase
MIPAHRLPGFMAKASAVTPAAIDDATRAFSILSKPEFIDVWRATVGLLDPDPDYRSPIPLCLIRGAEDKTGNIATAIPKWAEAEGIEEHVVPGAGHFVSLDAPAAVTGILDSFLSGLVRGR